MEFQISIIIPTMNRPESLINTIRSIINSTQYPNEIIIVDQSKNYEKAQESEENVKKLISDKKINLKYVYLEKASLTGARNLGLLNCNSEIMICMDDDIELNIDTIENISLIMRDNNIAMIAGLNELEGKSNSIIGYLFAQKSLKNRRRGHIVKSMLGRFPLISQNRVDTQWAMGYFFVVRKSLIEKWNLKWDEKLISYGYPEDLDFSYSYYKKAYNENMKCIIDEKVKVKHLCSQEYRVSSFKQTVMYIINREYLSYKHFPDNWESRLLTRWANLGEMLKRVLNNNRPIDVIRAQYYCDKYRRDIKNGNLHYELYDL